MNRRTFLAAVIAANLASPWVSGAQPATKMPRVGILSPAPAAAGAGRPFDAFREALRELGYVDG